MNKTSLAQIDAEEKQKVVCCKICFVGDVTAVCVIVIVLRQISYPWTIFVGSPTLEVLKEILCFITNELRVVLQVDRCAHAKQVGHLIQLDRIEVVH